MKYMLKVLSMFEMGQRDNQEDYMFPQPGEATDECRDFILCDGMGGHDSGEVASNAVCCAMGGYLLDNGKDDAPFTKEAFLEALNFAYSELDARDTKAVKKMGTTMTFLKFHKGGCFVAHIGDSRVYHLRPSQGILFETRDHSLVNDLIKIGELTEEEALDFPNRNVITRCMQPGKENRCRADVKEITDVREGDYFFMCSDGVNETLDSNSLAEIILSPSLTDEEKIEAIRKGTEEASDNHTAFLVHVISVEGAPEPVAEPLEPPSPAHAAAVPVESDNKRGGVKIFAVVVVVLFFLAAIASLCYFFIV